MTSESLSNVSQSAFAPTAPSFLDLGAASPEAGCRLRAVHSNSAFIFSVGYIKLTLSVFRPQGVDTIPVYCDLTSLGLLKGKLGGRERQLTTRRDAALCDRAHRLLLPTPGQPAGEDGRKLWLRRQLGGQDGHLISSNLDYSAGTDKAFRTTYQTNIRCISMLIRFSPLSAMARLAGGSGSGEFIHASFN